MIDWANFYNGLARGLALVERDAAALDWEWLSMSLKGQKTPCTAAGCLLSFGLTGHIKEVNVYNIHELITKGDRFLTIALLLGCAIAHRGTSDIQVSLTQRLTPCLISCPTRRSRLPWGGGSPFFPKLYFFLKKLRWPAFGPVIFLVN